MGKAILVLDEMPLTCDECQRCPKYYNASDYDSYDGLRPRSCPLKELPERAKSCHAADKDIDSLPVEYKLVSEYMAGFDDGWNAFINEICGTEDLHETVNSSF